MLCESCGQEIPEERLEALPNTCLCKDCIDAEVYSCDIPGLIDGADPLDMKSRDDTRE